MDRRELLEALSVVGVAGTIAGCSGLRGNNDGGFVGEPVEEQGTNNLFRVDFVDQADTLGQVENFSDETGANEIVNNYSESEWQEMDDNDLDYAEDILSENDATVEDIRPYVEDALDRNLSGSSDETADAPPGEDEPDERAIMYGIGVGMGEESGISSSFDSANVLKPLAEHFADEYLDNDTFETWITGSAIPATEGRFAHLPVTMAYSEDGEIETDYVEPSVPFALGLGGDGQAIRSPEDSVYSDEDEREMVTGHEYSKALEMAQNGHIELEGRANPIMAISTALLGNMWGGIVDSARNDISYENPPPNGLRTHVTQEFGESVENAFYNLDEEKLGYMENIGRAMQLFYEDRGGSAGLAVGGTLEDPEFYEFTDGMGETLWSFDYDSLQALEG